ncbi:MAG: threonine synthase, partial [Nitrospinae bacterium]|nr:threonine synthase [Nitrospinota bacterium]
MRWRGVIERYREFLPVTEATPVITLNEGNTPLIQLRRFVELLGVNLELYVKYEGVNPTGSFKDRGMTVAVSKAVEEGSTAVICASTGNTSASAAAYAVRGNLRAIVVVPEGKIAVGKFVQALIHHATVIQVKGSFDDALGIVLEIVERYPITLVNSLNPHRIEGQKTAAFEVCDQLGGTAPTYHILPVGNAGNITANWRGYVEYAEAGRVSRTPVMMGFQAEGAAPIVRGQVVE